MTKQADLLSDFLDTQTIKALSDFISQSKNFESSVDIIAKAFGASGSFSEMDSEAVSKLVTSFKNNLTLLIQKTWVEKSDIEDKDKLLYQLNSFLNNEEWAANYPKFLSLINDAVFLMFGQNPDTPDFPEYALRIDPEFGIFWWFVSNLPAKADWSEEKIKVAMLLGMYFLANY